MKRLTNCPKCMTPLADIQDKPSGCGEINCRGATVMFSRNASEASLRLISEQITAAAVSIGRARGHILAVSRSMERVGDMALSLFGGPIDLPEISERLDDIADLIAVTKRMLETKPVQKDSA